MYSLAPTIPDLPLLTNWFIPALTTTILKSSTLTDYREFGINYWSLISTNHYQLSKQSFTNIYNDTLGKISHLTPHAHIIFFAANVQTVTV